MDQILREIALIPNAPFLYRPSKDMLRRILARESIANLSIRDDEFALYARIRRGNPPRRLMIVTHIDHPAIVLKDSKQGIAFGSVGHERIHERLASAPIPLRIYDPKGSFQQSASVKEFRVIRGTPLVSIEANAPIEPNSHAIWDITPFEKADGVIKMLNADNGAVTAVALQLLIESSTLDDVDIEVVFVYVEEVHQIASTGIAARGTTPFGTIDKTTFVINLEAMEIETTASEEAFIRELGLTRPDYNAGIVIKINDGQLVYGLNFAEAINEAELLFKCVAEEAGISHQHTLTAGSTDAKSFSLFPLTPHIVTIAVPCKWKHNQGPNGAFVPEEIHESDLVDLLTLLKLAAQHGLDLENRSSKSLTLTLKRRGYGLSTSQSRKLRKQRVRLMRAVKPRLSRGIYFDTSISEFIEFNFWRAASKLLF